jgi:dihydrodipicolinate synthase/N-acetylneuraminate lyase
MNPLVNAVFSDVNPIPIKTALRHMGYSVGELRPLCAIWRPRPKRRLWSA